MPKFSIIATDQEDYVGRSRALEGLKSIARQKFKDFELLIIHDGNKKIPYSEEFDFMQLGISPRIMTTEKFYGIYINEETGKSQGWGHHSRELGIKEATGQYIINFNVDNILFHNSLQELSDFIDSKDEPDVIICPIYYEDYKKDAFVLQGIPPEVGNVDLLQCIAKKEAWMSIGGFNKYVAEADGLLIKQLCDKYSYQYYNDIIGMNR